MAAARMLWRRIPSFFSSKHRPLSPLPKETSSKFFPSINALLSGGHFSQRGIETQAGPVNKVEGDLNAEEAANSTELNNAILASKESPEVKFSAMSNLTTSSRHDLAMVFTCKVCETRSVKTACRESYEKGVVVVRCGGCNNLHLIADRLGWFGEPGSIEDFLASRGEEVKKGSVDTLNLTLEDLAGT